MDLMFGVLFLATAAGLFSTAIAAEKVGPLLSTQWNQRDDYAQDAPRNQRVGCWSAALGQILYYHKLFPRGHVRYTCTDGTVIDEDLNKFEFPEDHALNATDDIARYLYAVSVVIQKDFGTGDYCVGHKARARLVSRHFGCRAALLDIKDLRSLDQALRRELDQGRPVMMHLSSKSKSYHATAVDGYETGGEATLFHINMGHGGEGDGWFRLDKPIDKYDDTTYHKLVMVAPLQAAKGRGKEE
jgi:hypothetical protein